MTTAERTGSGTFDVAVVGAGILGLATARELLVRRPHLRLVVVDKEASVAAHQTGHNSGVLHAGLYYQPGSLKARLCRSGKAAMERYAEEKGIPVDHCGKLVIAADDSELAALEALRIRAEENDVPGLEMLGPDGLRDIEPHAVGSAALWSPSTGIIDYKLVAQAMADDVLSAGAEVRLGSEVTGITARGDLLDLATTSSTVTARHIVSCAGLHADQVARMTGSGASEQIVPFRGDYYTLTPAAAPLVKGLIYPVPDPRFPFLGIHLTKMVDGRVLAGPNAVLATSREGYRRRDLNMHDVRETIGSAGFRRLARNYWRTGMSEMWRDWSKSAFLKSVQRFVPELRGNQLIWGPAGVRAQAIDPDGTLVDDFRLDGDGMLLHVRNAPSPAATASLAIAGHLVDRAEGAFTDLP